MSDIADIKDLIRRMCISLVGQTVIVNWQPPLTIEAAGEVYLKNSVINININPVLSAEHAYKTALHEVGHCIAGHKLSERKLSPQFEKLYAEEGPFIEKTSDEWKEYSKSPDEVEAQNIADELDRIADGMAERLYGNSEI